MTKRLLIAFCLFALAPLTAQIHEIGIFGGGSNYIGDVGETTFIKPKEFAIGGLYKWNRSPRHSWRASVMHTKLAADDLDSDAAARQLRGLNFSNSLTEISLGLEFNFFDFNLHDGKKKLTPYVYTGLSGFFFEEKYYDGSDPTAKLNKRGASLAIPMIVGLKTNIADHWVIGAEVGARWTFTDNLDGSFPKNESATVQKFGNINNKDWYVLSGITLTYTFGNKPCYCAD